MPQRKKFKKWYSKLGIKHEFIDQHYQSVRLNEKMTPYKTIDRNYVQGKNSTILIASDTQKGKISPIYFQEEKSFISE